ncbi:MAG: hypothetical protein A2186_02585 [Candidatus Levybacteria bacterium RIFOXYA1_FULL_41_10]|nr:MAG: hypothetical protein UT46_C0004G0038 [Candidatus Levybacteria bacterium GW2011_GWA1_39_34]KKR51291.1 MAG: hypothetical protein UT87_C0007G0051 [Candidatus Levybacteria bacterium GW2011_GWC1_40_19]KKR73827.1 MAG: hypothetical protein UU15_C0001G0002 [Candidatus Levybacteria bacterium GW2011_GWC2_40_7]KKR94623.1 MAG: hypothetical protein UU45_C0008G0023 [Candidatus Levybacteria bacterium GW2011_GWA2_41_15]KKS00725.1 MAG: hypothetical protein UU52_C0027G0006 [Candidatus Levybacteria bacter
MKGKEALPTPLIHPLLKGPVPKERAQIFRKAAKAIGVSFKRIPNSEITDPFQKAPRGMVTVEVDYGEKHGEFWKRVLKLSPPPPPKAKLVQYTDPIPSRLNDPTC